MINKTTATSSQSLKQIISFSNSFYFGSQSLNECICHPTSPMSLTFHLDRDYDHPRLSN